MLDLQPEYCQIIAQIAHAYAPNHEVRVFGSRVRGMARRYSDADLAFLGAEPLSMDQLIQLKETFENSTLPFRGDIVDWHRATAAFKASVEAQVMVVLNGLPRSA
ncbi:MAG: nucleotidyltransferase domain-containing protein [bacterium]